MKQLNWYQIFGKSNIPDGRTVEPTDDIQIWLHCANIWDKTYTTLAEVLADTDTLLALISSNNAVDYMVRSTTWAESVALVPAMTSNTTPSGECFASSVIDNNPSYYAYKSFDGNSSTYWISDRTTTSISNPDYLGYEFASPTNVYKVVVGNVTYNNPKDYILQAYDGDSWEDIVSGTNSVTGAGTSWSFASSSADKYSKWRLYVTSVLSGYGSSNLNIGSLQFYSASITADATAMTYIGLNNYASNTLLADATWSEAICNSTYWQSVLNAKNPDMTSNTAPSGVASANGNYTDYYPWKALDGNDNTSWASPSTASLSDWLKYEFATDGIIIKKIRIKSSRYQTYKIQASNDNANWTDLYSGVTGDVSAYIENTTRYKYIKYVPTSLVGGVNSGSISEFKVYGREDV